MSVLRSLLAVGMASATVALTGCSPQLKGLCTSDLQCPAETACVDGICVAVGTSDGGEKGSCDPACGSGLACDDGRCVSSSESFINILSPSAGAVEPGIMLTVPIQAHAPDAITDVALNLQSPAGAVLQVDATPTSLDGYTALLDLSNAAVTDGDYELVAEMKHGSGATVTSASVPIVVDKTPPVITVLPITYPSRASGSPATNAYLRDEQITVKANITDALSGLSTTTPPSIGAPGMAPVVGTISGNSFAFSFSARSPTFNTVAGPIQLTITATDVAGNVATANVSVQVTRLRWIFTKPRNGELSASPALTGTILTFASSDQYMYGVSTTDGTESWELAINNPAVGHISIGPSGNAYAVTSTGFILEVNPAPGVANRLVYFCPQGTTLHPLVAGGAVGFTPNTGTDSTQQETLFVFSQDGYLLAFRQKPFPVVVSPTGNCGTIQAQVTTATNTAGVPALQPENGSTSAFMGDDNGAVHAVSISIANTATAAFSIAPSWNYNAGAAVPGPVAIGAPNGGAGLLFGDSQGLLETTDLTGGFVWNFGPIENSVSLSTTIPSDGTFAYPLDQGGEAQKVSLTSGKAQWTNALSVASRSTGSNAAPVEGADGTVYLPAGTNVAAVSSGGAVMWTFNAMNTLTWAGGQAVDIVSPLLSCSGDLYVTATNSTNGFIHDVITDSTGGPQKTGWPRAYHDNHNTSNNSTVLYPTSCTD